MSEHGYGRYRDDPVHVGCPRANSDMTPCVARDGHLALADDGVCVGCERRPDDLLREVNADEPGLHKNRAADKLKSVVWVLTDPMNALTHE